MEDTVKPEHTIANQQHDCRATRLHVRELITHVVNNWVNITDRNRIAHEHVMQKYICIHKMRKTEFSR